MAQFQGNAEQLDMDNRDPNHLNSDKRTLFEEAIGEPKGSYSADCVWLNSYKGYTCGYNLCYTILTYVCAIPSAFCWGCHFSCITFFHIWHVTPCARSVKINFDAISRFLSACVHCCMDPCYESMALMFTQFWINISKDEGSFNPKTYAGLTVYSKDERRKPRDDGKGLEDRGGLDV